MNEIRPFQIDIPKSALDDLAARLERTRWPDAETIRAAEGAAHDWNQGVPLAYAKEIRDYWLNEYDWPARQAYFNRFPQFMTDIDGLDIHFIHRESAHPDAVPLVLTHGWPGSIVEFHRIIEPLADPTSHGGAARDAFHVVCPSLPGFGFSGQPESTGWNVPKIADAWDEIMARLGYDRYFAQGGDWGTTVSNALAARHPERCAGIHVNMPGGRPRQPPENPTEREKAALARIQRAQQRGGGYGRQQSTRPQTLGYALADSPMGQAAWILEKFFEWTDCDGRPENAISRDELLDNVMFYWLTDSGTSSARIYWENNQSALAGGYDEHAVEIKVPTGCSIFPKEITPTPRNWAEERYPNIVYWNELDKGGHFAAFEQPEVLVDELRKCFRLMR